VSWPGQETRAPASGPIEQVNHLKQQEITVLEELVRDCPGRPDPQILLALTLYRHGRDSEAVGIWTTLLAQHPQRTDFYNSLGLVAFKKGDYEQAIAYWQQALKVNPRLPKVNSHIGMALMAQGKQAETIAAFQREIEISPQSATDHFYLAQQFLQQNQLIQAIPYYERAVALNPKLTHAYYGLFQAHSRLQEHEQAQPYLQTFKQLKTQEQQARREGILAFDDLGKTKNDTVHTYVLVSRIYLADRKIDKAQAVLRRVITLVPEKSTGYRELASLLLQTGKNPPEAQMLAQQALSLEQTAANYFAHGRACEACGDFAAAFASLKRAVALEPDNQTYRRALDHLGKRGNRP
jgi:tetratricopeptide (TPR) repeat protein